MPVQETHGRAVPPSCRWRTSDETLDVIEALERIEALLARLDERVRRIEAGAAPHAVPGDTGSMSVPVMGSPRP